jgi:methylenetetrahydrofolate reductase (NADPH)
MKPLTFEVWPSRTPEEDGKLRDIMRAVKEFNPPYVSVTVSDRRPFDCTLRTARLIQEEFGVSAMPHIRCLGRAPSDFCRDVDRVVSAGMTRLLVLRGDHPASGGAPTKDALQFAAQGIGLIRSMGASLRIAAACHPETHEDAIDDAHDLAFLCAKVRA